MRAAKNICGDDEFYIIGSQSLHGKYPNLADQILMSQEVDIISKNNTSNTDFLNAIGADSPFHAEYGYYADPVDLDTAVLPKNWKNRLVNLKIDTDSGGAKAYCLEPHDLVVAKLAAGRDKDKIFIEALLEKGLIDKSTIAQRITETRIDDLYKTRMSALFSRLVNAAENTVQAKNKNYPPED